MILAWRNLGASSHTCQYHRDNAPDSVGVLRKYSMCCRLYSHLSLEWLRTLSPAYLCNAWACWPTLVPKAGVIHQDEGGTIKTQQEGRFHYSELHRGIQMLWHENLVVMVIARNHSMAQNHHPLPGVADSKSCSQGNRDPVLIESRQGNAFTGASLNQILKGAKAQRPESVGCSNWEIYRSWDWVKLPQERNCGKNLGSLASLSQSPD